MTSKDVNDEKTHDSNEIRTYPSWLALGYKDITTLYTDDKNTIRNSFQKSWLNHCPNFVTLSQNSSQATSVKTRSN